MTSVDTNVLLYSVNESCPEFDRARGFVEGIAASEQVVICELVLVELYLLLRNPAVLRAPLDAGDAVEVCRQFRSNPRWRTVEHAPVMHEVWLQAADSRFARRRILDARLALTLRHHGVTDFATRNVRDFSGYGFTRVWSPVEE